MDTKHFINEHEDDAQNVTANGYSKAMEDMPSYDVHMQQMQQLQAPSSNQESPPKTTENNTVNYQEKSSEERRAEELSELIKEKSIFSKEAIDFVYDDIYPDGIPGAKDEIVKQNILKGLRNYDYLKKDAIEERVYGAYTGAYKKAFRHDETTIPEDEEGIIKSVSQFMPQCYYPGSSKFAKDAKRVTKQLINLQCANDIPHIIEKISDDDVGRIKFNAAISTLKNGEFFPKTFEEDTVSIDGILNNLGLDKNNDKITKAAIIGYGGKNESPEIDYFDLENKVADLIYTDSNAFRARGKELQIYGHALSPNVSKKALAEIQKARSDLINRLKNDAEFGEIIEEAREQKIKEEKGKLYEKIIHWNIDENDIDFEHYLDTKTISVSHADTIEECVENKILEEPLRHFIYAKKVCNLLKMPAETETAIDYADAIQESLLARLEQGMGTAPTYKEWSNYYGYHSHRGERAEYLTKIFETESFKRIQERIDLDFSNPEVFNKAFKGFINTLDVPNGEFSEQADWYYQNIFSTNPEKFGFMIGQMWQSKDTPRGLKGKITRFKNSNEAFQEYKNSQNKEPSNGLTRSRTHWDEVKKMLNRRKKELYERAKQYGIDEADVFSGHATINRTGKGGEHSKQQEVPIDFGIQKVEALHRYYEFIRNNIPNAFSGNEEDNNSWRNDWFVDGFAKRNMENFDPDDEFSNLNLGRTPYIGFTFDYKGKKCAIMESLDNDAAMWAMRFDDEEEFDELLTYSRFDAMRTKDSRIAQIRHRDVQDPENSIDGAIQEAFLYFETGNNEKATRYGEHDNGKAGFESYLSRNFPDEAIGIDRTEERNPGSLEGYRNWQARQIEEQRRLADAMARGGEDAMRREAERIAQENAERLYNETLANT